MFDRYIGIDYSGAKAPVSRLKALQVFEATPAANPVRIPVQSAGARNWCRKDLAEWCTRELMGDSRIIIGIDHGFSFPLSYMRRHGLKSWPQFLEHFYRLWPTDRDHMYVDFVRETDPPSGRADELRLCEKWTPSAKSVFQFDVQGTVAKATHAGIVWLYKMRRHPRLLQKTHFWPFDGFDIPEHKSVLAEAYPSLFRRRYPVEERGPDEQDAYSVSMWLKQMDGRGSLRRYLNPPLALAERRFANIEGWIIGVY
ncbi:MAG: hypothetical protein QF609_07335 [Gammaproteobacteria bacterium]|jgi:hypothetical protein|nr:hypothetical protein [Gammaproteobacteria bacterium]